MKSETIPSPKEATRLTRELEEEPIAESQEAISEKSAPKDTPKELVVIEQKTEVVQQVDFVATAIELKNEEFQVIEAQNEVVLAQDRSSKDLEMDPERPESDLLKESSRLDKIPEETF